MDGDDDLVKLPPLPALAASLQLHPAPEPEHSGDDEGVGQSPTLAASADSSPTAERASDGQGLAVADGPVTPRKGLHKTLLHISEGDETSGWQDYSVSPGGSPGSRRAQGIATNNAVPWRPSPSKAPALPQQNNRP